MRTIEDLRRYMLIVSSRPNISDQDLIWFVCVNKSNETNDMTTGEVATLFLEGIKPIVLSDVQDLIDTYFEGIEDEETIKVHELLLKLSVAEFYNKTELSRQLRMFIDSAEKLQQQK